jgi:hypothetical protein
MKTSEDMPPKAALQRKGILSYNHIATSRPQLTPATATPPGASGWTTTPTGPRALRARLSRPRPRRLAGFRAILYTARAISAISWSDSHFLRSQAAITR